MKELNVMIQGTHNIVGEKNDRIIINEIYPGKVTELQNVERRTQTSEMKKEIEEYERVGKTQAGSQQHQSVTGQTLKKSRKL